MIFYAKQTIEQSDIDAVTEVLRSDFLTQGPALERFEQSVAEYCGAKYAVATCNATAALHIACLSAGLGSGDVAWTSPNTFVASANCVRYVGAEVNFVDIDSSTYNLSVEALEQKLEQEVIRPKVVIPVHFAGQSCEMERINGLAEKYGFTVIEDASHAIGGSYKEFRVGSCRFSDMTVLSFHPVKIITTGEGGMVLTNSPELYEKLCLYRSHGVTRCKHLMKNTQNDPWYYEQVELGFNYRMTDIQAALGISQLARVDAFVMRRRQLAARYNVLLHRLPLVLPAQNEEVLSAWHLYVVRYNFSQGCISKQELFAKMKEKGIVLNLHYIPVHTQPYYRSRGFALGDYPTSERYYDDVFTLPLYYGLTEDEQDYIVTCLRELLE